MPASSNGGRQRLLDNIQYNCLIKITIIVIKKSFMIILTAKLLNCFIISINEGAGLKY